MKITVYQFFEQVLNTDKFKPCHFSVRIDLKDFLNMRDKKMRTVFQWDNIKHNHVMESGRTIWSLSDDYWRQYYKDVPIGQDQPPTELVRYIYDKLMGLPTFTTGTDYVHIPSN